MEIRPARPEEYDAVGDLTAQADNVLGGHLDPGHRYVQQLRGAARRADEAELLVAVEGGRVLGHGDLLPARVVVARAGP